MSHLLIVDDDSVLQSFLSDYLAQEDYTVSSTGNGEDLVNLLQHNDYDLVILDVVLPGRNGFYWLNWIRQHHPALKVIILSVKDRDDDRINGLESGANDYLCKPFNPRELLARINNQLRPAPKQLSIIEFGDFSYAPKIYRLIHSGNPVKLTTTEAKILTYLSQNPHKTLTRDDIALSLRGDNHHPLDRSIDVHINRLRRKIEEEPSMPRFIHTVWGKGYQFVPD